MEYKIVEEYVKKKHEGQTRKDGITPYYLHPIGVAKILEEKGFDELYRIVGLCHDLIEDTDTTYEELLKITNKQVVKYVMLLTKEPGYIDEQYIKRISKSDITKMVKLADRIYNLRDSLNADEEFRKKYIIETEQYYVELAKGTIFEEDMQIAIENVKKSLIERDEKFER